ncbi:PA14 domain-containing protein [Spirosoma rigui]|uniref:PA14 domain-containing protein n=1 Tax=Spirosoma rigui TaxID=564064 RepID=UPI0009B157AA|nr:PA14 domain-containing protein [Spirosoma rigui]
MNERKYAVLLLFFISGIFGQLASAQTENRTTLSSDVVSFSFTLPASARTSAGVYAKDSTLLRTLWSGVSYPAGTHQQTWDGLDDEGRLVADGSYTVQVLSNNVTYTWEGVIGNTSYGISQGNNVQRAFLRTHGMAITGNTAYYGAGYAEGNPSQAKFSLSAPQKRLDFFPKGETAQATWFVATDGSTVYWAGYDGYGNGNTWFVFGTNTSDDKEKFFPRGAALKMALGKTYASCFDVINESNGTVTGLAVQKKGKYLFVSHKERHQIRVFDKTTGAQVQALFFNDAAGLAIDGDDNLWVINGSVVRKYAVQASGALTETSLVLAGLTTPMALAVSPDNNTVVVADGGASQQLKAFNNQTGAASWTLGQLGGYSKDPTVSDDKFYFSDASGGINDTFIAFAPDGSFWVGDSGNYRVQHYAASRNFIDRIQYLQHSYSSAVDQTNPKRVFNQFLEFAIDYSKPLASSWTLVRNWRATVPAEYFDVQNINHIFITDVFKSVTTLRNGRTYALVKQVKTKKWNLVELPASGPLRFTGLTYDDAQYYVAPDGSFNQLSSMIAKSTGSIRWLKQPLTGFDTRNDPIWGTTLTTASTGITNVDPIDFTGSVGGRPGQTTSSGLLVTFNKNKENQDRTNGYGFHLGAVRAGGTKWAWKTAHATTSDYTGIFPPDGAYDIGNSVEYAGGDVTVSGKHIFWNYHGEFWKNSQTNKWNHVYDNGLFVGQFGVVGPETNGQPAFPGMAGNVFYGHAVAGENGNVYIWHTEESGHGGMHRWKVSGLETIKVQTLPVTLSRASANGLLGVYTEGSDLNVANIRTRRVDRTVSFTNATIPANGKLPSTASYSVRWTGFLEPQFAEEYTLFITAGKGARLWVDNTLLIDQATAGNGGEYNATIALEANKRYPIRVESFGGSLTSLAWSSASQPKQLVDNKYLFPASPPDSLLGLDLLDGLDAGNVLVNKLYGWERNPAQEDYTDANTKYWTARTGIKTYGRLKQPDLYVGFRQNKATYTITRSLGESTISQHGWRLVGNVNQEGSFFSIDEGRTRNGGSYLEVLDDAGKVIARVDCQVSLVPSAVARIYGNDKVIAQGEYFNGILPVFNQFQPLDITLSNGTAIIKYGPYPAVTTGLFDPGANWHKPRTLRLFFWGNGYNLNRIMTIESMRFFAGGDPTMVLLSANDEQNTLDASSPMGNTTILVSENGGPYVPYTGTINVGNVPRPEGYWMFRLESASSAVSPVASPAFTTGTDTRLSVYPNPAQKTIQIQHPVVEGDCEIKILSIDGKELSRLVPLTGTTVTTAEVGSLPRGSYLILFRKNNTRLTTRFIK